MPNMTQIDRAMTINDIVAQHPETAGVFHRFGLDTCCGGGVSVSDAAQRHGLDVEMLLEALRDVL